LWFSPARIRLIYSRFKPRLVTASTPFDACLKQSDRQQKRSRTRSKLMLFSSGLLQQKAAP
jgi:hypothetical protein